MSCQWQAGLLIMRPCGELATAGCALCGRALCMSHTVLGPNGPACPQCASANEAYPETEDTEIAESRSQYFHQYGGSTGYGRQGFFSDTDRAAMSQRLPPQPAQPRRAEDYDAMET